MHNVRTIKMVMGESMGSEMEPGGEPAGREKVGGTGSGGVGVMMNLPVEGSDRLRFCWEFSPNNSILLQGTFSLHSSANYQELSELTINGSMASFTDNI